MPSDLRTSTAISFNLLASASAWSISGSRPSRARNSNKTAIHNSTIGMLRMEFGNHIHFITNSECRFQIRELGLCVGLWQRRHVTVKAVIQYESLNRMLFYFAIIASLPVKGHIHIIPETVRMTSNSRLFHSQNFVTASCIHWNRDKAEENYKNQWHLTWTDTKIYNSNKSICATKPGLYARLTCQPY